MPPVLSSVPAGGCSHAVTCQPDDSVS